MKNEAAGAEERNAMNAMIPIYGDEDCAQVAFELFAGAYPHEAAQQDWEKFFAFVKSRNPAITAEVLRQILERTK